MGSVNEKWCSCLACIEWAQKEQARRAACFDVLVNALESIAMRASCAPNDDEERADEEFTRIMREARAALEQAKGKP